MQPVSKVQAPLLLEAQSHRRVIASELSLLPSAVVGFKQPIDYAYVFTPSASRR